MITPYDFGYEFGRLVKRADFDDDALEDEKAEVRNLVGWNGPRRRDAQRAPATTPPPAAQRPAQNLAGMLRPAATTPPPASGLPSMSQMFRSTPKPVSTPATTPPPSIRRALPKLPSGPTSSPNFKGAVE